MTDLINLENEIDANKLEKEMLAPNAISNQVKYTNWENEPTLSQLQDDFLSCRDSHNEWVSNVNQWNNATDVTGDYKPKKIKGRSSVQPRLIKRQNTWRYSALSEPFLSSQKIFQVKPRTFEDELSAKQNELLLNWQFDTQISKVKFIDDLVRVTVDEGTAVVKVGWDRQTTQELSFEPIYNYLPASDQNQIQLLQQLIQQYNSNIRDFIENNSPEIIESVKKSIEYNSPTIAIPLGSQQVIKEKILVNKPYLSILHPENVYIDPSCEGDLDKAMFVITSFETNKALLNQAGIYFNLDKVNWDMSNIGSDTDHYTNTPTDFNFSDTPRKKVVAYEYWGYYDIHNNNTLVPIVATWIEDTLIRLEESPYPDKKVPFVIINYSPVKRSIYGEPDAALLCENQNILGAIVRGMIDLFGRSANSQQGFAKGFLDKINKVKFDKGENYEFNPGLPPQGSYIQHTFPELPMSAFNLASFMNQDAESLSGIKTFYGGISGEAYGQVATGIRGVLDASGKREMSILRRLAQGIKDIGTKIIAMNYIFLSDEETIRVTNRQYVTIKKEDLKGNFDLVIDISTHEIDESKAQDLAFLLQTIGNNLDTGIVLYILSEIAELKHMPTLAEKLRTYQPQPNPMGEAQMQKLQSDIEVNKAKANKLNSDAQATNVDTQMELDGTKHKQNMEKQQAQAQANSRNEITKALLRPTKDNESQPDIASALGYQSLYEKLNETTKIPS